MFGEERYYQNLARTLLDKYSLDELLYELDIDPVDFLSELLLSGQLNVASLSDDEEEA